MNKNLQRYVTKKFSGLDKYVPKTARESAHIEVVLKEAKSKNKKEYTCEAVLHLPKDNLAAKESTMNMFAAVDIVQEKLKVQLKKYKDLHVSARAGKKDSRVRHFLGKISSRRRLR
jgi:ribosomal subunit interface protein